MAEILLEQALYGNPDAGGYRFLARSAGFHDDWLAEAERLCTGFGERPAGVACPECVFARPLGKRHVAVVQVADQGNDDAGRPGALGFRLLVLPRNAYTELLDDPFQIAERFPPAWQERGSLPTLSLPREPLSPRTVEQVQQVLRTGPTATLLGGAQALLDGSRVVFERSAPAPELVRGLWALLPHSTRAHLWPASFAFGNGLQFDALVVPRANPEMYEGYLNEEQAGDYPESQYELSLQVAAEAGDQRELDALFSRRSSIQTVRLALYLLILIGLLAIVMNVLNPPPAPPVSSRRASRVHPQLEERYPALNEAVAQDLTVQLSRLADQLGGEKLSETMTIEQLLEHMDRRLGTPDPQRDCGPIQNLGQPERQLRALLWKHGVADYNNPRLNPIELVERLQQKLALPTPKGKEPHAR